MTLNLQPKAGCSGYLIKLPGLSVEFGAVVLAHNHQHVAGWVHGLCGGHLQEPLWAVPLSILPGTGGGWSGQRGAWVSSLQPSQVPGQLGEGSDSRDHEQRGVHSGVHNGLQVIDPTHQQKAWGGETVRGPGASGAITPPRPSLMWGPSGQGGASPGSRARG